MARLIGDIGGTNTRLAVVENGRSWANLENFHNDDFDSLSDIILTYTKKYSVSPRTAAFAVAGPVRSGEVTLTNRGWKISAQALANHFALDSCEVVNDFTAVALGVPALEDDNLHQLGGESPQLTEPKAILGPGTGLGVAGLIPSVSGGRILVTEGGHMTLAPQDDRQAAIISGLRRRFAHVSAERAISGQGLENLYAVISEMNGKPGELDAEAVGRAAESQSDAAAIEALAQFFRFLGGIAGDLALAYGAFGGVYLAGGIVPRYLQALERSEFRASFEAKGRMRNYVRSIPVYVILHPEVELLGLAASLTAKASDRPWPHV